MTKKSEVSKASENKDVLTFTKDELDAYIAERFKKEEVERNKAKEAAQKEKYHKVQIEDYGVTSALTNENFIKTLLLWGITADQATVLRDEHIKIAEGKGGREKIWSLVRKFWKPAQKR